jgi:tetratricopeptide (TPR) repeat protein
LGTRYAKPSRPAKRPRIKLSTFQLVAAIGAVLLVCGLISSIVGTIILDQMSNDEGDEPDAAVNSSEIRDELRENAERNPDQPMAQAAFANYLANTGDIQAAIPFYERAIALDPENWAIRLDFAQSLSNSGLLADAELQLDRILELDRQNAQGWFYLAELYQRFSPPRTDEAIYAYQQVIRFDPTSFVASQAQIELTALGVTQVDSSPVASPEPIP